MNTNPPTDIYGNLTWLNKQVQKLYCLIESLGGGGSSITINPTNGYVPVRTSATTFGDSAILSNELFTRIQHEFADNNSIMRLFISAEEGFRIENFSYDFPDTSQINLNGQSISFDVVGDGLNSSISINQNSVVITSLENGDYFSNLNASAGNVYINAQYTNADNVDDKFWARQTFSNTQIVTNVYTSNGGDFETSYTETILPGYLNIALTQEDLGTQLRTTYVANSITPSINTTVIQGDDDIVSLFFIQKDLIQLTVFNRDTDDSGCTFKIYISGASGKTRYNFSNIYTYASNAAALANGLAIGDIYRHGGGALNIVH